MKEDPAARIKEVRGILDWALWLAWFYRDRVEITNGSERRSMVRQAVFFERLSEDYELDLKRLTEG